MKKKKLSQKERRYRISLLAFFIVALVISAKSVYAYYFKETGTNGSLFAAKVGDFYDIKGIGDISIRVFKQAVKGGSVYVGDYKIPTSGYTFVPTSTKCTNGSGTTVSCTNGGSGSCTYSYSSSGTITIKSNQKAICSFYFNVA